MAKKCIGITLVAVMTAVAASSLPMASAQSLWAREGTSPTWSFVADRKAHDVGDIVTIIISERTTATQSKSGSNEKSGKQNLNAGIGIFDFLAAASASGSDSFEAKGSASDTSKFTGNVTVMVTEVLPNGNMVVEGTQSIWQHKNEHKISLKGIIRQDDVSASNTVPSTKVANAVVRFDGKGPLNAKQRQGILTQIFNILF